MMRPLTMLAVLAAVTVLGAGCGGDDANGSAETPAAGGASGTAAGEAAASAAKQARGARVTVVDSEYGKVIADRRGEAFYLFDKERTAKPECYGECARVWPPVLTKGKPVAGPGVRRGLLGTTKRANGKRQVTYGGRPLYYYVDDSPGTILCHNVPEFGGLWLVVEPGGKAAP